MTGMKRIVAVENTTHAADLAKLEESNIKLENIAKVYLKEAFDNDHDPETSFTLPVLIN